MKTCEHIIGFGDRGKTVHKGFGKYVKIFTCPACSNERRLGVSWRGGTPPGGFVCGGVVKEVAAV